LLILAVFSLVSGCVEPLVASSDGVFSLYGYLLPRSRAPFPYNPLAAVQLFFWFGWKFRVVFFVGQGFCAPISRFFVRRSSAAVASCFFLVDRFFFFIHVFEPCSVYPSLFCCFLFTPLFFSTRNTRLFFLVRVSFFVPPFRLLVCPCVVGIFVSAWPPILPPRFWCSFFYFFLDLFFFGSSLSFQGGPILTFFFCLGGPPPL